MKNITLTGADDSVLVEELLTISKQSPFVEWGILHSDSKQGKMRYPTQKWIDQLIKLNNDNNGIMNLSAHLCGDFAQDAIVNGHIAHMTQLSRNFNRIQLNFNAQKLRTSNMFIDIHLYSYYNECFGHKVIIQYNKNNEQVCNYLIKDQLELDNPYIQFLFDSSEGNGITPESWPEPIKGIGCGYAGGLATIGSDFPAQLKAIAKMAGDTEIWIDMESSLRDSIDGFNIQKVAYVLEQCKPYIAQ